MRNWSQRGDVELLGAARDDPEAFAAFYDRYEIAIVGYFARRTRNAETASELAAETFANALGAATRYRPTGPTAAAWLFTIAHNVLLKSARRGRVEDEARARAGMALRLDVSEASKERIDTLIASADWVERVLAELPVDQRLVVRAHILEDRSYAELAETHQVSQAAIRQRVSRGLANLRRQLERTA